jgi:poly-gamma-glutamate capsule biosynthesis protein CapA/YwtB (metallophosphatase superfamily)
MAALYFIGCTGSPVPSMQPPAPKPESESVDYLKADRVPPKPSVRIAFVGDILLGGGIGPIIAGQGIDYPWVHAASILQGADLAIGNLETSVSRRGRPVPDKQFTFRADPKSLEGARRAGIDLLSLANNHTLDFGRDALTDTIQHAKEHQIEVIGAGQNAAEAFAPAIRTVHGLKIAIFGFTRVIPTGDWAAGTKHPGLASGYDPKPVLAAIEAAAPSVDAIIVLFHWGEERADRPRPTDRHLAEAMLEKGATVVIGHHPHVLQAIDRHPHQLIAYSLGNFIFTAVNNPLNQQTAILEVTLGSTGVIDVKLTPFHITAGQPRPVDSHLKKRILDRLDQLSRSFHTRIDSQGSVRLSP